MRLRFHHLTIFLVLIATVDYRFFANMPGVPSFTLLEIIAYVAAACFIGRLIARPKAGLHIHYIVQNNPALSAYFLWIIGVALINLSWSSVPAATVKDIVPGIVLFFFISMTVKEHKHRRQVIAAYLIGSLVQVFLASSQVVFGGPRPVPIAAVASFKQDISGGVVSIENVATGLFMHPNALALFMVPLALLILAKIIRSPKMHRLMLAPLLLVVLFVIWHAQVKGAFVWLIIGAAVFILSFRFGQWRAQVGWVALIGGISSVLIISLWVYSDSGKLGTVISRIQLSIAALTVLIENPRVLLLGGGSEAMFSYSRIYSNMEYPSSHNTYLDQAILFGLPGLLLYLAIARSALKKLTKASGEKNKLFNDSCYLYSAMISLLGMFFFEPALYGTHLQALFFMLVALSGKTDFNKCAYTVVPHK